MRRGARLRSLSVAALLFASAAASAQTPTAAPSHRLEPAAAPARANELPLGTGTTEGMPRESWHRLDGELGVRNVSRATLTPVLPAPGTATGAAVIVAPGGGFLGLSMESEGFAVAHWLADHGIAAFVLKYRTLPTPAEFNRFSRALNAAMSGRPSELGPLPDVTPGFAVADGLAALKLVRAHGTEWRIDPKRVGMIGFSAGGFTTLSVSTAAATNERPAFIASIYGPMVATSVPADAPPLFIAVAADDFLLARGGFGLIDRWRRAGRSVEVHLYATGGHGFGLGRRGTTTVGWIENFRRWLEAGGFLKNGR